MTITDTPDWANKAQPSGLAVYPIGSKTYENMTVVGGYDETNGWTPLNVDESGTLVPNCAQLTSGLITVPGSGAINVVTVACWLKSIDVVSTVATSTFGGLYTTSDIDANCLAAWEFDGPGSRTIDLDSYQTNATVIAHATGAGFQVVVRYRELS